MSAVGTPLMQQYREIKSRHQDAILFFRMGDFYETFFEDAEVASRVLGITLTSRNNGGASEVPLAGVPVRALNDYLRKLVQAGLRVAICEQVEDPKLAKGIVRREVVETVSPGVAYADDLLEGERNNYVVAVARPVNGRSGVAAADVSTGELRLFITPAAELDPLLARLAPREVLFPRGESPVASLPDRALVTEREPWEFDASLAGDELRRHFAVHSLDGLGLGADDGPAIGAAGVLLRYLRELQPAGIPHLARPQVERPGGIMPLDEMTRRNLELVESLRGGGTDGTLLAVLDRTQTPMGARLLRQWLLAPLTERARIEARLEAVDALQRDAIARDGLREALDGVRDVERLAAKVSSNRATPRELQSLGLSLSRLPRVHEIIERLVSKGRGTGDEVRDGKRDELNGAPGSPSVSSNLSPSRPPSLVPRPSAMDDILTQWDNCAEMSTDIGTALVDRAPMAIGDEETIARGVDAELDDLRVLRDGGKDAIARIQQEERERTGITSLKVGFNRVFGYFIEITNANKHLVPGDYQRRQTLTGAERYVTPALKEYEEKVLHAAERIEQRERELFEALRARVGAQVGRLQCAARAVAQLDVLASLADVAAREGYVRPVLGDDFALEIRAGRHPVVERMMPREQFIPNDVVLTPDARMIILTGPNMAGKSTILRQVGLIVLMAQVGSFVPAASAQVGVCDRVFTRVGASDNLVRGQSTFMVEMAETSAILHTATRHSLVLLDEIGRGTSTYDGVSIAWAVSEHLHERTGCKTIFATHYHELTQLADELVALRNYNVGVREVGDQVLFLHRLMPGGADRSYGIEVGRLAGLPQPVIERAKEVLKVLESGHLVGPATTGGDVSVEGSAFRVQGSGEGLGMPRSPLNAERSTLIPPAAAQYSLFAATPHPVLEALKKLDINALTPLDALQLLARLTAQAREG